MLEELTGKLGTTIPMGWFDGTVPVAVHGGRLTLSIPGTAKEYIKNHFLDSLLESLERRFPGEAALHLVPRSDPILDPS